MSLPFLQNYLGLSSGLQTRQASAGGSVGGWVELGRTTLGSANANITVSSLANKRYYMVLTNSLGTNAITTDAFYRMGYGSVDSAGSRYSKRESFDGSDSTTINATGIGHSRNDANQEFSVGYIANYASKEKLFLSHKIQQNTAGAGNAPKHRLENTGKWIETTNPLDTFNMNSGGADTWNTGSEVVVLGYDPADTHTTNFWTELASVTLTGTASTINSGTITAKKYLWIQAFIKQASTYTVEGHFNGDTGSNYAYRYSGNGGADGTGTSTSKIPGNYSAMAGGVFINMFVINNSANEKLVIAHTCEVPTTGAGTAPGRMEFVNKWANTASQITSFDYTKETGSGDLQSGSTLRVWGSN